MDIVEDGDPIEIHDNTPLLGPRSGSSYYQSLFNSCNLLLGIGLLSLPFAFQITGWIIGLSCLFIFSLMTWHTGNLLKRCLDYNHSLTLSDLGQEALGNPGRIFISIIFFFELIASSVALLILSSDSIVSLFPELSLSGVKIGLMILIFPLTLPKSLSIASFGSFMGLCALINLTVIILYDGISTTSGLGSLWTPQETNLYPPTPYLVPFSFGLIMSGFAGHGVFPNIYRDMKTPSEYKNMLTFSYLIVFAIYALVGCSSYLMFGDLIKEEVTQNLAMVPSFNPVLTKMTVALVAFNPVTKYPLSINPINGQIQALLGWKRGLVCAFTAAFVLAIAILFPGFHHVMALLGSFFSFTISVVFPEICFLVLFGKKIGWLEYFVNWAVLLLGTVMGLLGTIWVFLPIE